MLRACPQLALLSCVGCQLEGYRAVQPVKLKDKYLTGVPQPISKPPALVQPATHPTPALVPPAQGATKLISAAAAGDTTLQVSSNDGFYPGAHALVGGGNGPSETVVVESLGSIHLSAPLVGSYEVGAPVTVVQPVVEPKWFSRHTPQKQLVSSLESQVKARDASISNLQQQLDALTNQVLDMKGEQGQVPAALLFAVTATATHSLPLSSALTAISHCLSRLLSLPSPTGFVLMPIL